MKNNFDNANRRKKPQDNDRMMEVSIDCVVFGYGVQSLEVMLIEIGAEELQGSWALPGDLVYPQEDIDEAAHRVLRDLTGLAHIPLQQAHAFGEADRVPGRRVVTIGYYAIVNKLDVQPQPSHWANKAQWFSHTVHIGKTFDHADIIRYALDKLRHRTQHSTRRRPLWEAVLPQFFTLSELQQFFEVVLNRSYDKGNFRKKLHEMPYLVETELFQEDVSHRPARLFTYDHTIHETHIAS